MVALTVFISGCSPAGPRALLNGKKYLDRGDNDAAVAELKIATTLLATNAQAWNYYGVALQRAGQPDDAANAYQRAFSLDRDLMEAHYNLGCLWLEQNNPDAAKTEFTTYTLRRSNAPEGWLKLGSAQLRSGEIVAAERSFSTALYLNTNNAEAYNGLGLARIQRGRPRDAAQFFAAAIEFHPEYAPAYLNLATVSQQYLRDNKTALQNYRAYLALVPHAADWNDVNEIANNLEQPATVAATLPVPIQVPAPVSETRTQVMAAPRYATAPRPPAASAKNYSTSPPSHPVISRPAQVVQVQPEPEIVSTPPAQNPATAPGAIVSQPAAEVPFEPAPEPKSGFWHKLSPSHWFGSDKPQKKFDEDGVTPLPSGTAADNSAPLLAPPPQPAVVVVATPAPAPVVASPPFRIIQPAAPAFPRYVYSSPRKPAAGNRAAAAGAFTQARDYEQDSRWLEAMQSYEQAAQFDPSWFEAQYNFGVLSYRLRDFDQALAAYERALAIQPDSTDARYNFGLALKSAGYVTDAVIELKKVVSASPDEVRAHLALGNIYAHQLHDVARARVHYLKVLDIDPRNPQATDIRFWLTANPE